ncbi:hypothetical protein Sru01_65610 [Sphaerisporangium rufum]|uniref:VWFA domain-containing protein n=1 Tax=Sphaerisporangium rufum TaxID=1381558 RepID=A0A919R8K6_9ACTN|nr:substrate-binding domain-containing protein [Sphaerisporangium rufum]GII81579.1 hypothetical protein Sru01_65610 [Sphaerisporangium rufum]
MAARQPDDGSRRYDDWEDGPSLWQEWQARIRRLVEPALSGDRRTRARRRAISAVVAGGLLLGGLSAGAYSLIRQSVCTEHPRLRVAAAPEIAPAVAEIARRYTADGGCAQVSVRAEDPAAAAVRLGDRRDLAEVWIPDSSVWIDLARVRGGDRAVLTGGESIARSPVVLAARERTVSVLRAEPRDLSWSLLVPSARVKKRLPEGYVRLPAPDRFAAGLLALHALHGASDQHPGTLRMVQGITTNVRRAVVDSEEDLFGRLDRPAGDPLIATSEQAVWRYNGGAPRTRAVAVYPREGTTSLDYPYVVLGTGSVPREAAADFLAAFAADDARTSLRAAGFRDPDGRAGTAIAAARGVQGGRYTELPGSDPGTRLRLLLSMQDLLADRRVLLLLESGDAMAKTVPGGTDSLMKETARFFATGIGRMSPRDDVGLWTFGAGSGDDGRHREVVRLGPVVENGPAVQAALRDLPARPDGGRSLYDTLLAAIRSVARDNVRERPGSIVLFTAGKDDGKGISLTALLEALRRESSGDRPVPITLIGYGDRVDAKALRRIAEATKGAAMMAHTFDQARQVFFEVLAGRVCVDRERCGAWDG